MCPPETPSRIREPWRRPQTAIGANTQDLRIHGKQGGLQEPTFTDLSRSTTLIGKKPQLRLRRLLGRPSGRDIVVTTSKNGLRP